MKIDNQIIKQESNKNILKELYKQSDKIWDIQVKIKSSTNRFNIILGELTNCASQIDKIIEKYEKEGQEDE